MERGFDGLYNHVNPNVSTEALVKRLEYIVEFVEETKPGQSQMLELQREVDHIAWEIDMRNKEKIRREEEIAWMEKALTEESNG